MSLSCTAPANSPADLESYYDGIDTSCQQDADCVIKDVHNCCGHYPQCVNSNAFTDPALVQRICQEQGLFGACGYPVIESCECRNNRCSAVAPAGEQRPFLQ